MEPVEGGAADEEAERHGGRLATGSASLDAQLVQQLAQLALELPAAPRRGLHGHAQLDSSSPSPSPVPSLRRSPPLKPSPAPPPPPGAPRAPRGPPPPTPPAT